MFMEFTASAAKVMTLAKREAQRLDQGYIQAGHVLLGLVGEGRGVGAAALKNLDVDFTKLRTETLKSIESGAERAGTDAAQQTVRAWKVIEYAWEEARALDHNYVGTEHILLGLLRETKGSAAQALMNLGLKLENARQEVLNLIEHDFQDPHPNETDWPGPRDANPCVSTSVGTDGIAVALQRDLTAAISQTIMVAFFSRSYRWNSTKTTAT